MTPLEWVFVGVVPLAESVGPLHTAAIFWHVQARLREALEDLQRVLGPEHEETLWTSMFFYKNMSLGGRAER
jgi:hypothetical protein